MSNPDFSVMSDAQLRDYVLSHRQDGAAFYAYVDRMQQRPPVAIIEPEEWSEEQMQLILDEKRQSDGENVHG